MEDLSTGANRGKGVHQELVKLHTVVAGCHASCVPTPMRYLFPSLAT